VASPDIPQVGALESAETVACPVPLRVIVVGESVALLVTVTLPLSDPLLAGVKVTLSEAV
jgi:hypothetical protein